MDCLFCNIAQKKIPSEIVHEDEKFLAFKDINPKALFHVLIIPKKHIESLEHLGPQDKELMGELILEAQKVARENNLEGYNLRINVGRKGGQLIDHLHLHVLSDTL